MDRSEIGRRSKRKGKTYERRCAKLLTKFTDINFRKTPSSGGFNKFGGVTIREELFCGDVICDDHKFKFCVEAKNRKDFSFISMLKNPHTATFSSWWYQCIDDANRVNMLPIMFFKPDNAADFVSLDFVGMSELKLFDLPHFKLDVFDKQLDIKIRDGNSSSKVSVWVPNAYVLNWKSVTENINSELLFKD